MSDAGGIGIMLLGLYGLGWWYVITTFKKKDKNGRDWAGSIIVLLILLLITVAFLIPGYDKSKQQHKVLHIQQGRKGIQTR